MDKKSILGIVLIFAILIVFQIINRPSEKELAEAKRVRDSIAQVELDKATRVEMEAEMANGQQNMAGPAAADSISEESQIKDLEGKFGVFGKASVGEEQFFTVESNLYKIVFTNKGGRIYSVELKGYQTNDSLPLILFDGPETKFGLNFFAGNRVIQTNQLFFTPKYHF